MENLAQILKDHRREKGLTQPQLAGLIGIGHKTLQDLEAGKEVRTVKKIQQVNAYLEKEGLRVTHKNAQPDLMQALVTLMNTQNEILRDQKADLVDRVRRMETNLNAVAGIAESLQYDLVTGRDVVLRSLARIEGLKNEKQLLIEADKMRTSQAVAKDELYKSYEVGIKHKVK